jgi:hypothetical protein
LVLVPSLLPFLASRPGGSMLVGTELRAMAVVVGLGLPLLSAAPTTKYRIDQSLSQEIDASGAGGPKQKIAFRTSSFVSVTLADSAGGKLIRVVIDSLRGDSATPIPAAVLDSAKGSEFRGFLARSGKPSNIKPTEQANSAAVQVQGLVSDFFPWARSGLKVGDQWSDTTANTSGAGSDTVTVRRISAYHAAATEVHNARKAVRVTQEFTSSVSGTQPTPQGPAHIEGTGTGKGSYYVGPDGGYLGGTWQQQSSLTISGTFSSQPLPVTIVQKTTVTTLK